MGIDLSKAARDAAGRVSNSASARVRQEVAQIRQVLQAAADRDVTGPVATVLRRIEARAREGLIRIEHLERQLQASSCPGPVKKQLQDTLDQLFRHIAMDWMQLKLDMSQPDGTMDRLQKKLPRWLQNFIDLAARRGGVPVAGGALKPFNLENTTGTRREPHFRGEVVPHHALPEIQRKGLRPDGLEWVFHFQSP